MFRNINRGSKTHLILTALAMVALMAISTGLAFADNQTKSVGVKLTEGDFKTLKFTPGAPGKLSAKMEFKTKGLGKDVALRLQIIRPDNTVAKEGIGGDPLLVNFTLGKAEFEKFKGKAWTARVSHDVPNQKDKNINGDLTVTFPIATVTVFDNSNNPIDVASRAQTEVSFKMPSSSAGKIEVTLDFRDGTFNTKELKAELLKGNTVLASKVGTDGLKLVRNVAENEVPAGTTLKVRLSNDNLLTVKKIAVIVKFTPNN